MESLPPFRRRATVLAFPQRRARCQAPECGAPFVPLKPWHRLCSNCYRWARIGAFVMGTKRQFEKLREADSSWLR